MSRRIGLDPECQTVFITVTLAIDLEREADLRDEDMLRENVIDALENGAGSFVAKATTGETFLKSYTRAVREGERSAE